MRIKRNAEIALLEFTLLDYCMRPSARSVQIVLPGYCFSASSRHFIAALRSDSLRT